MAANDDLTVLSQFFEWLGESVTDEEKSNFLDLIMERRGHKRVSNWTDGEGNGKQSKPSNVLGINKKTASGGSNWQYGSQGVSRRKPCGKITYRSKATAERKMLKLLNSGREEIRVYPCARCHGWHLTSRF